MALTGVRTSIHGWHQRLAHPHEPLLRRLVSVFRLPVTTNKFPDVCDSCQLGKSHRLHLSASHVASLKPFELVYSDVWGPSPHFSLNGNRYFLLFIDDCTKYVWIYFMSHKSQVFTIFQQFHQMVKTQFQSQVMNLQTDWGGEFRNVSTFLQTQGIHHRVSCPYTQEQNGAVERRNRIIVEKGLALLAQSNLPQLFWEHAFKTATYLHNRTITPTLNFDSPYKCLYHTTPDYSFLKTFGCLAYPFLRPYNSHKLDFRSLPCIFLGYSSTHKGYLCYHQPSSRLYVSRHVVFNESVFPYKSQPQSSAHLPPSGKVSNTLLQHASSIPRTLVRPSPNIPSTQQPSPYTSPSPSPLNSHSSHTHPVPTPPSYRQHTQSSKAKATQPSTSHYRPAEHKTHRMLTRASTNSLQPKTFSTTVVSTQLSEPCTYSQAVKHNGWQQAMKSEYDALMRNGTWLLVPCPTNANIVGCKWIYRIKRHSNGTFQRYKARLVAQGYSQEAGVDYTDTFSPVVKPTTIRLVLSIALSKGWSLRQLDINNAFLNGDLTEEVYMRQPKGFEHPHKPDHVCRLRKAIYGLKQAPRAWFTKLKTFLLTQGFRGCRSDTSLFVQILPTHITYILVYVDDLIITGSNDSYLQTFINRLDQAFALKDLGKLHHFLGLEIVHEGKAMHLSQSHYISEILAKSHMQTSTPISTPADPQCKLTQEGVPYSDPKLYRQIVGSLQYVTISRPDITYAVNRVCQFMHSPTTTHWQAVKRILRYLNGTLDHCLHFRSTSSTTLLAYSDAGWVSDPDDSRSKYGYAVYHGPNLISWTSRKQKVVARSSTEAEYRALAYTAAELVWLQQLIGELHAPIRGPPLLLCDNIGAIFLSKNPVISTRSKHVALDFHFIRELVESGELRICHVSTLDQIADIFTKPMTKDRLSWLRSKLQVRPVLALAGG
ncbi:Retrovirus-related Pol polyprotein from transposon TNT 1-94 [Linum perenne]